MPNKVFLEITNACNLKCDFCHGTKREIRYMSIEEFTKAVEKIRNFAQYLYFHLMGEPLLHKNIGEFLDIAHSLGFKVILTTNGTLLKEKGDVLLRSPSLFKVSISLQSFEGNGSSENLEKYLSECCEFCRKAAERGVISVLRLWNIDGKQNLNDKIILKLHSYFDKKQSEWTEIYSGYKICEKVFLEWGDLFEWPDINGKDYGSAHGCRGLRDQIGILSDGTVVPCCLDADGEINLGNIFESSLTDILNSPRTQKLKKSLEAKNVCEELCRKCGYAYTKNYR